MLHCWGATFSTITLATLPVALTGQKVSFLARKCVFYRPEEMKFEGLKMQKEIYQHITGLKMSFLACKCLFYRSKELNLEGLEMQK